MRRWLSSRSRCAVKCARVVIVGVEDNGTGNPSEVQERPAEVVRET
jgi:hypothetical protein